MFSHGFRWIFSGVAALLLGLATTSETQAQYFSFSVGPRAGFYYGPTYGRYYGGYNYGYRYGSPGYYRPYGYNSYYRPGYGVNVGPRYGYSNYYRYPGTRYYSPGYRYHRR